MRGDTRSTLRFIKILSEFLAIIRSFQTTVSGCKGLQKFEDPQYTRLKLHSLLVYWTVKIQHTLSSRIRRPPV